MSAHRRHLLTAFSLVAAGVGAMVVPPSASAAPATFTVDTLSDNPADGLTLREAIAEANGNAGEDTIEFEAGLAGTITMTGGEFVITDDIVIDGPGADVITIDAAAASRIFHSSTPLVDLDISGLHLANASSLALGGAIYSEDGGEVVLDSLRITDSHALDGGGALINGPAGQVTVTETSFEQNSGSSGGGLYVFDPVGLGPITIISSSFEGNKATGSTGGGAYISGANRPVSLSGVDVVGNRSEVAHAGGVAIIASSASVIGSSFVDNEAAASYGGLFVESSTGDVLLSDSVLRGNSAVSAGGAALSAGNDVLVDAVEVSENSADGYGGLFLDATGAIEVTRSTIEANAATSLAGGLLANGAATFLLRESTVRANTSDGSGGGLTVSDIPEVLVQRSTISGNTAAEDGGGVMASGGGDQLQVSSSTISGNVADVGGAVHSDGYNVRLRSSTVVENEAVTESGGVHMISVANDLVMDHAILVNDAPASPDTNQSFELDWSILGTGFGLILTGTDFEVGVDPDLGTLGNNGGPTETHLPSPTSIAVDGGNPLAMVAVNSEQRGFPALVGVVDIGSVETSDAASSLWTPVDPARIVDTRDGMETVDGIAAGIGAIQAVTELSVDVAGRAGVPADAIGVVANITAVRPDGFGFLTAHSCLDATPLSASLNYTPGVSLGNETIIELDADGDMCVFSSTQTHLTVDVVGYIAAESPYVPLAPSRFLDTRPSGVTFDGDHQGGGMPGAGGTVSVPIQNRGGIPDDADAAVVYIASVGALGNGFVTASDCDGPRPLASSLNHVAGVNRGNEIVVDLGSDGDVCIFTSAAVHVTVDVVGYVPAVSNFEALADTSRLLDTRPGEATADGLFAGGGKLVAGETLMLDVAGRAGLPLDPETVAINLTAVSPEAVGYVTAYPCGGDVPNAASLNFVPGVNGGNEIIASLDDAGRVCLYVSAATHLTVDATGSTTR